MRLVQPITALAISVPEPATKSSAADMAELLVSQATPPVYFSENTNASNVFELYKPKRNNSTSEQSSNNQNSQSDIIEAEFEDVRVMQTRYQSVSDLINAGTKGGNFDEYA